jgi:hypothetical protein
MVSGHTQVSGGDSAGDEPVGLGELGLGGETDLEAFRFAGPALAVGLGDAGQKAAADVGKPVLVRQVYDDGLDAVEVVCVGRAITPWATASRCSAACSTSATTWRGGQSIRP